MKTAMWIARFCCVWLCAFLASNAAAQPYPSRPIKIVLPYAPGGVSDGTTRVIARELELRLGQPVVVENRPGANGLLASDFVAKSLPDGYTLLMLTTSAAQANYFAGRSFDAHKDFAAIGNMLDTPVLIVINEAMLPNVRTLADLIAEAKARPLNYTSTSVGSTGHLGMELLKRSAGIGDMTHVPYKGATPAIQDVVGGRVPIMFADIATIHPFIKAGRVKPLAIGTAVRVPFLPDVPTINESGLVGFEAMTFFGLAAPARTPHDIVGRLAAALKESMADPAVDAKLRNYVGSTPNFMGPEEFANRLDGFYRKWTKVAQEAGVRTE